MEYQNTKTGYVLRTNCEVKGEDWVRLDPAPKPVATESKDKPKKARRSK